MLKAEKEKQELEITETQKTPVEQFPAPAEGSSALEKMEEPQSDEDIMKLLSSTPEEAMTPEMIEEKIKI